MTSHSWQSMKYRYRARLAVKHSEAEEANTTEEHGKVDDNETEVITYQPRQGVLSL